METVFYLTACSVSFAAGYLWRYQRDKRKAKELTMLLEALKFQIKETMQRFDKLKASLTPADANKGDKHE